MANINMYDNLVTQAPNGAAIPNLATSWTVSPDGLTWVFNIVSGVHFHNGDPMTSADVVFSMQRELAVQQGFAAVWLPVLSASDVTALNATAVQFKLKQVYAPFLGSLSLFFVVDKNLVMQHLVNTTASNPMGDWGVGWLTTNDAGSGPYALQNWNRDVELTLTRFPGYWKGWSNNASPFTTVNYQVITSDATTLSLAKDGQMDWVGQYVAVPTYQALQAMGWTWNTYASPNICDLKLNLQSPPMNNIYLRKALSYAFNYSILPVILPGAVQSEGPVANTYQYHEPNIFTYSQNATAAKAELKLAEAQGLNPSSTTLTITYVSGNTPEQEIALEFQKDVEQILGINVNVVPQTWETITELAAHANTTPQITVVYYDPLYPDTDTYFYPQYDTVSNGTWISMEWMNNATINGLIAQERASLNATQRQQIFYQLQTDIVNMAPDIFLFNQPYYNALSPRVGHYTFFDGMSFDYNNFDIYYLSSG
jgi:peptide/nickel transport system substrate-binding protein